MPWLGRFAAAVLALGSLQGVQDLAAGPVADAAKSGDLEALESALAQGADADEPGIATPLYFASQRKQFEAAALLIEHGADVNSLSKWGAPLHVAAKNGDRDIVSLLLENGADPNLPGGEEGWTPLFFAAYSGSLEAASLLIDKGADIYARAGHFEPAIHIAVSREKHAVAELLRAEGFRPTPVEPISPELASADVEIGRKRSVACTPCHTYEPEKFGRRGPSLWNIVGRKKASVEGFAYSPAMKAQQGIWDYEALNQFLADVHGTVPGTIMYFGDEPDQATRIALIAYLRTQADDPSLCRNDRSGSNTKGPKQPARALSDQIEPL